MRQAYFYANTMAQQQPQRTLDRQQQQGSVNEYQSWQPDAHAFEPPYGGTHPADEYDAAQPARRRSE